MNIKGKIKVLHIVGAMNMGGTETMLMNIYRNVDKSKVQFDFISYSKENGYYDNEIISLGGQIIKLNNSKSVRELCEAIKKYGPYDVVHAHTLFNCGIAMIASNKCGVKVRIAHSHTNLDSSNNLIKKIYMKVMRYFINNNATKLLSCSEAAGIYLFGEKYKNSEKYIYFPNIIDYSKFLKCKDEEVKLLRNKINAKDKLIIGHIGRFTESKNHKFLIDIIKNITDKGIDAILLLVGDGPMREYIEDLAKEKGIYDKVRFLGVRNDIDVIFQTIDVFVFPSIYEGLGLVMLEAQASGIHSIVSDAIQPEADLKLNLVTRLSLKESVDKWVDNIMNVYTNRETNKERIIYGFESTGYSIEIGIKKLMNIYKA